MASADQPLAGTAAVDRAFLLVEHPGPWGRKALAESRLPEEVRTGLAAAAEAAGVRVQLIRRHHRSAPTHGFRVFLAYADPVAPWVETTVLEDPAALLGLDLAALAGGERAGLEPHDEPLLLVCTNGRRDACCAELGRPLVATLGQRWASETWETTHLGGHRFAGAMLVLPHALSYGRVTPAVGARIATLARDGRLDPAHLRGRSAYPPPVQAAEIALLEHLGRDGVDDLALLEESAEGGTTLVRFHGEDAVHEVRVTPSELAPTRQSCADEKTKPGTAWQCVIGATSPMPAQS